MISKVNSTPKITVMPVRLCDLHLPDDDLDDEDETTVPDQTLPNKENEMNPNNSNKTFEQIKLKISEGAYTTPLKPINSINTPQIHNRNNTLSTPFDSKVNKELYKSGTMFSNKKNSETDQSHKEDEIFSTPCNKTASGPGFSNNTGQLGTSQQKLIFTNSVQKNEYNRNACTPVEKPMSSKNIDWRTFRDTPICSNTPVSRQESNVSQKQFNTIEGNQYYQNKKSINRALEIIYEKENVNFEKKDHINFTKDLGNTEILANKCFDNSDNGISGIFEMNPMNEQTRILCAADAKNVQREYLNSHSVEQSKNKETVNFKVPNPIQISSKTPHKIVTHNGVLKQIILAGKTYDILNKLGSGGSSVVHLARHNGELESRAIKVVNLSGDQALVEGYMNEVQLLSKLQGSNVVIKMFDYVNIPHEKLLYMVMECGESDFSQIIKTASKNNEIPFPIATLVNYWIQMLEAVKFIHDHGVVHSDLKPANFLKVGRRLKLIDFGIASSISNDCTSIIKHVQTGTFNYMSPEALQDTSNPDTTGFGIHPKIKISFKSDVWSLGCILYLLLYGNTPFGHISRYSAKIAAITDPKPNIKFPELELYPAIFVKTAKRCLVHDPYDRPSVAELLQLPRRPFRCAENHTLDY